MDFWVIFGSKKLENYFYFDFAYSNGIGHPSSLLNKLFYKNRDYKKNWLIDKQNKNKNM